MMSADLLVDTNVWVFALCRSSPWHHAAVASLASLESEGKRLCIAPQIARELVGALTRSPPNGLGLPPQEAIVLTQPILDVACLLPEDRGTVRQCRMLIERKQVSGKQVHDANLVAIALAHRIPAILTHNVSDFARYQDLISVLPLEPPAEN